ncbi:MAG TPA: sugar phosphate nucleotidyltransferase [Bryobacteraceae bacterium]|nr:sugar phosphate nucleotidyltransferase [Bryobacteraceae bacterium]
MQAVILAGGLGTRLWPLTKTVPKPLVPVGGVPYLEHQMRLLKKQSITDVVLLIGYLGEQVREYFSDGADWGMHVRYSVEPQPLGTGGALRQAAALLSDTFLVIYGDSYLPIQYAEPYGRLLSAGVEGLIVAYDNRLGDTSVKNNIDIDDSGYVKVYDKDSPRELHYVEAGVLALRKSCLKLIPPAGPVSLEKEIFPLLIQQRQLAAYITGQRFYDIGTADRLRVIEEFLSHDHHPDPISN